MLAFRDGDFSARMPSNLIGVEGKIADAFNDIVAFNARRSSETVRVSKLVGKEGRLRQRMYVPQGLGAWADEMLRGSGFPVDVTLAALGLFDVTRSEVIAGQFLDVSVQARGHASVETAMTVLRYKSAKYSIERPLHIGAALAGASAHDLEALSAFGLPLGEAFQLRDDLLGVYGDPATTGKPAGDDLVEGKRTVLVALALEGADDSSAELLDSSLGRPLTEPEVDRLRSVITASGAQARVEAMITELCDQAVAALESAPIDPGARDVLRGLAAAATQRAL